MSPSGSKKRIVFCPVHATSLDAMLPVACHIQKHTDVDVIFLLGSPNMIDISEKLAGLGLESIKIMPFEWNSQNTLIINLRNHALRLFHLWVLKGYAVPDKLFRYCDEFYHRLTHYYCKLMELLPRLDPVSVVLPDDRSLGYGFLPAIIKASADMSIRRIVLPVSYAADKRNLTRAPSRKDLVIKKGAVLFLKYPDNIAEDNSGTRFSFYPPITTEVLFRFGALPGNPWVMGGGGSDMVLVDGEEMKSRYIGFGCSPDKLTITGHPAHDQLFSMLGDRGKIRDEIRKKYGTDKEKLTILSLPQMGEIGKLPWDQHWKEIRFLCETFSEGAGDTLISLHPKMNEKQYRFIEAEYGIPVANEPLREILPAADYFAASFSSTVEWAVLCGIPTIVFDFYNRNYDMYNDFKGVVVTSDRQGFPALLNRVQGDPAFSEQLKQSNLEKAAMLSPFDGMCTKRIAQVCCHA